MDTKQVQEIQQVLDTYRTIACSPDRYQVKAPEALRQRAAVVYEAKRESLAAALKEVGAADADIAVILEDYRGALLGNYEFKATVEQIHKALEVRPRVAYKLGKFEVHAPLYTRYTQQEASWNLFLGMMRTEATIESRRHYILSDSLAFQVCHIARWAAEPGRLRPSDFEGVTPGELSRALMMAGDALAGLDYFAYIFTAKYGLNATHEELEMVNTPESATLHFEDSALDWAESSADSIAKEMEEREMYFRLLPDPLKKAEERAEETAPDLETPKPLRREGWHFDISKYGALALSRPVEDIKSRPVVVRDEEGRERTPNAFINELREGLPNVGPKALARGLDMLQTMIEPQVRKELGCIEDRENGVFIFKGLNLSRLAEYASYKDAGEATKSGLCNFLDSLSGAKIVRPRESHEKKDRRRKKEPRTDIVRPFWLKRHADDWSDFDLWIAADLMYNDEIPVYITGEMKALIRELSSGCVELERYIAQLFTKTYKEEEPLYDDVFGYSYELRELTEKEAALRKAAEATLAALPDLEREYKRMKDADKLDALRDKWARWEAYKATHLEAEETERVHKIRAAREAYEALCAHLEELKKAKRAQGKNKARDRRTAEKWRNQLLEKGVLLWYRIRPGAKGKRIHEWETANPKDLPEFQEQGQAGAGASTS